MNEKNEPVNFEVIYQVTDRFIDTFSFLNVSRDDNEHIYLAVDDKTGDGLSYDCSYNTLKISFGILIKLLGTYPVAGVVLQIGVDHAGLCVFLHKVLLVGVQVSVHFHAE